MLKEVLQENITIGHETYVSGEESSEADLDPEAVAAAKLSEYMDNVESYILWGEDPDQTKKHFELPTVSKVEEIAGIMQVFKRLDIHFDQSENPATRNSEVIKARKVRRDKVADLIYTFDSPRNVGSEGAKLVYPFDPEQAAKAACRNMDPDIFYPQKGEESDHAKSVCKSCVIIEYCLDYALDNEEEFGVWGGKGVSERKRLLNARNKIKGYR